MTRPGPQRGAADRDSLGTSGRCVATSGSMRRLLSMYLLAAAAITSIAGPAAAHTDPDVVAVPAGADAVVTLKPAHGCGDSPTVGVSIRADVSAATAGAVDGWTATATADAEGRTVVEWSGGTLAADQPRAFPIHFTAPDAPGELLLFPSIQVCENGEELAWIDGDPESDYPAPRILILPADYEPAATIDEVPPDAPGRDQLVTILDVDAPGQAAATTTEPTGTSTSATAPEAEPRDGTDTASDDASGSDESGSAVTTIAIAGAIALVAALAFTLRRRASR